MKKVETSDWPCPHQVYEFEYDFGHGIVHTLLDALSFGPFFFRERYDQK